MEMLAQKFAEQTLRLLCWNQRAQRQVRALPQTVPWVVWESARLRHPPEIISLYFLSSISKIFGGSKLNLRSKVIKSLFLTNKGDFFFFKSKAILFTFKWHQGTWEKHRADIPRIAALHRGIRGWTKGYEVCQSYHGWWAALLFFTCHLGLICVKPVLFAGFPHS